MKKAFNKLPPNFLVEDLKLSKRNEQFLDKLVNHLKGYVTEVRLKKYIYSMRRFADLIEKDFDKLTREEGRIAGGIIISGNLGVRTKQDVIKEIKTSYKILFGNSEDFPDAVRLMKAPPSKGKLNLPKEMPTEEDIYNMIKACHNSRDQFFIGLLGLDGALRPVEARKLKWGDVKKDKYGHFVVVNTAKRSGDKDTRAIRIIKSEPYFVKWNQEYPAEKKDDAFVFLNYSDLKPMNQGTITALFNRISKKLNKDINPYLLRHSLLTRMSKNPEVPISVLKKFAGHSLRSNTIAEYQHFGDEDIKDLQLQINGIVKHEKKKEEEKKPVICPKCHKPNEYDAEFCVFCNMALSQKRMVDVYQLMEENNKRMFEQFKKLMESEK